MFVYYTLWSKIYILPHRGHLVRKHKQDNQPHVKHEKQQIVQEERQTDYVTPASTSPKSHDCNQIDMIFLFILCQSDSFGSSDDKAY